MIDFSDKSARTLAMAKIDKDNDYELNIRNAARKLCAAGLYDYCYDTQWSSGTTCWHSARDGNIIKTVRVSVTGRLDA